MEIGDCRAESSDQELQSAAEAVGSGANFFMVDTKPPPCQGVRAAGADQRNPHRDSHNPPAAKAARENSLNLTEHALIARGATRP
jgi:hypothetical protein